MRAIGVGERDQASQFLAQSLGAERPTTVMVDNLEVFFEPGPTAEMLFGILQAEARRRRGR